MSGKEAGQAPLESWMSNSNRKERNNRVPHVNELKGLRNLLSVHVQFSSSLDEQLQEAQTRHEPLLVKYQEQRAIMNEIISQIHQSQSSIEHIKNQRKYHQKEVARLSGLTHPIRRCPDDILRQIFEFYVWSTDRFEQGSFARDISEVCQRWRSIALNSPRVWACLFLGMTSSGSPVEYWKLMVSRIKAAPAFVQLDLDEPGLAMIQELACTPIKRMETLRILPYSHSVFFRLLDTPFNWSATRVKHLWIYSGSTEPLRELDIAMLLEKLPQTQELYFAIRCSLQIRSSPVWSLITEVELDNDIEVDIPRLLYFMDSLITLRLREIRAVATSQNMIVSCGTLKAIESRSQTLGDQYYRDYVCPGLSAFTFSSPMTPEIVEFLTNHTSITTLGRLDYEEDLGAVIEMGLSARIERLITTTFAPFVAWNPADNSNPPFAKLTNLTYQISFVQRPSLQEIEYVVRSRCLPGDHPSNTRPPEVTKIEYLSFQFIVEEYQQPSVDSLSCLRNVNMTDWITSSLYKEASRKWEWDPLHRHHVNVLLSWP